MTPALRAILADGRRRHFQHGPIDLIVEAFGAPDRVAAAYDTAWTRFRTILAELVDELAVLRAPLGATTLRGVVARRMRAACAPHRAVFVTPMAAVAGAVADEVLAAMTAAAPLDRAYVNNGGDIAIHLASGESFRTGIVTLGETPALDGFATIAPGIGGIATSGWRGRSFSLGIADSVTVLARSAAEADVAATLIANAVDLDDPSVRRQPANQLAPDSDLGARSVTVAVGPLPPGKIDAALARGLDRARGMARRGLIVDACLTLQGETRVLGGRLVSAA